ncbi:hypothetical protein [Levilactobacillus acidifarinae]|uniref:3D domain-containing protein n=1 Tax=Levilactobacillus acidifarinae DSM 19394 = JCM 15949 TaxID=1423715 RepID=A0A0R1LKV3_9LACO|nr:hypothetical protein [Levilactobacillus acidifarinae]KRK94131.1 hypothetical protein FD25_GL000951 [Levilactobacillus acidifarinae DSM 19394]GEO70591.1 hypothetical protein LAC03_25010 [Levilactobacillus acidifarinae]
MTIQKTLVTALGLATVVAGLGLSSVTANADTYTPTTATQSQTQTAPTYTSYNQYNTATTGSTNSQSQTTSSTTSSKASGATITAAQFESQGVVYLNGNKWTYYSGSQTADGTSISANGLDPNGYRVVAAPASVPFGTKIMTPLGMGVVHDRGTAITGNHYDVVIQ